MICVHQFTFEILVLVNEDGTRQFWVCPLTAGGGAIPEREALRRAVSVIQ